MKNQATQKQLDYLFKLGIRVEGAITKEVASDLIAEALAEQREESRYDDDGGIMSHWNDDEDRDYGPFSHWDDDD